ncbi:hypothetical protein DXG03_007543 [Asterophora parasitica]|uniref:Dihydrolipoamide acetyltransferase component of pyruvate dehydrogenase complex n=1 Tax=Asterophora parasitica TaxID=117018 RepID=A0A9P7K916_9AGAR|nr:hypothetical protein DXG03_007543 [Asterophora parasitica]
MLVARPARRLLGRPSVVSYFHTTPAYWATRKVIQKFKLADIGEGITECEVIKWSGRNFSTCSLTVQPASKISAFDPLCEVQSDKASVEITSPFDGVVKELLVQEGEVAKVGAGLCLIEVEEEDDGTTPAVEEPASTPAPAPVSQPEAFTPTPAPVQPAAEAERRLHPLDPKFTPSASTVAAENILAAPSVRHFARQNGVDLALLAPGSGKGGRIEKRDVEAFLAKPASQTVQQPSAAPVADQDVVVELGRTRYGMWKAMEKSLEIPHFGYSTTLDITALHHLLPTLNAHIPAHFLPTPSKTSSSAVNPSALYPAPTPEAMSPSQQFTRLTYLPILLKTLSRAMLEWPLLRSSITPPSSTSSTPPPKPTVTIRPHADISIALSTPTGLYTPTLTSVDTDSIYTLASRLSHLAHLGRQVPTALTPKEMPRRGGTITVSNVGAIGAGEFASPVLVPGGGVAIVALGRAKWVWDVDGVYGQNEKGGERRLKLGVSWSADHRVVEGAELAAFVETWRRWVERPERLIADAV